MHLALLAPERSGLGKHRELGKYFGAGKASTPEISRDFGRRERKGEIRK